MGGFNVTENTYPWVVSLQVILPGKSELTHVCTGSILSKTAILTAAHCDLTQRGLTHHIVFGTNDNRLTKGNIKAKKVIPHPDYNTTTFIYDAMILILEEPITFTKDVGPICLPDNDEVQVGQDLVMTGWGDVESFDNLLIKYGIVTLPLLRIQDFDDYFDDKDPKIALDSFRNYLLNKFKSVVPDFKEILDDNFKSLDTDETKKKQSLVKFKDMLQRMNIASSSDRDILLDFYPKFLNWLLKISDILSKGVDLSIVNGQFQDTTPLTNLYTALRKRPDFLTDEPFLKEAKAKTEDANICSKYGYLNSTENLCTLNVLGEDEGGLCKGDSGGPLAARIDNQFVVLGINSAVPSSIPIKCMCNCRDENNDFLPAAFQKTQTIMDWIKKTLKQNDALPDK